MSITHPPAVGPASISSPDGTPRSTTPRLIAVARTAAVLRIAFGLTFLWAFVDKTLALGFSTGVDPAGHTDRFGPAAWIHGGSPTAGFLRFGADGPFDGFYHSIAGAAWADWLFMLGLLGIGLALTLGFALRAAACAGVVLYLMMWSVVLPPTTNPLIDDHILGAISLVLLALLDAGSTWGLTSRFAKLAAVRRFPVLR